jgi:TonB-linked SusC/RagA family outer membrane protein
MMSQTVWAQQATDNKRSLIALQSQNSQTTGVDNALLQETVELNIKNATIEDALSKIANIANLKLVYSRTILPPSSLINIENKSMSLRQALWEILEDTDLQYAISSNRLLVLLKKRKAELYDTNPLFEDTVSGSVFDSETQEALPGVNIVVKGTSTGTTTDLDGNYQLSVNSLQDTLVFSFIGYQQQEIPINDRTEIDVALRQQAVAGEELIVTGYMQERKADVTGSISVVEADDIEYNQFSNFAKALQSRVPGMSISTDGDPGGGASVRIRGVTSVNGSPPLIVIDGMPTQLNLQDINSGDIESIQVLKDAASASIYGSRAAGGVILIETKKGQRGSTTVNYRGTMGGAKTMNLPDMLSTRQYGEAMWQAAVNDGLNPNDFQQLYTYDWTMNNGVPTLNSVQARDWLNVAETSPVSNTDWFQEGTKTGLRQKHQITLSTGTDNSRTLFSADFFQNEGTVIHSGLKRYSVRLNTDYTTDNDLFRIGENLALTHRNFRSGGAFTNSLRNMMVMPPLVPVRTTNGEWAGTAWDFGMDKFANPIRQLVQERNNRDKEMRLVGTVFAELRPLENLMIRTQGGINYETGYERHIDFTWVEVGATSDDINAVNNSNFQNLNLTLSNTVNYDLTLFNEHEFNLLGGFELVQEQFEFFSAERRGIAIEDRDFAFLNSATGEANVSGYGDEVSYLSYFSKLNYTYDSKYLLSATLRYDGSSVFGEENRFGFFPAFSAGWRVSNESFMSGIDAISELKLRASWGVNGNSNIPSFARFTFYESDFESTTYPIAGNKTGIGASGFQPDQLGNPELKWEETTQITFGVDFGLFEDRLTGSIDLYDKFTEDMLFSPPVIGAAGTGASTFLNTADMTNRGFEFQINYRNSPSIDFNYSIGLNFSSNENTIDNLPDAVRFAFGGNGIDDDIQGRSINSHYGFVADGLFRSQEEVDAHADQPGKGLGRIRYRDLNGDGRITFEDDRKWLGDSDPDLEFGLNFTTNYKNWDFAMFWRGVLGNSVYNTWKTYSDFWNVYPQSNMNSPTRVLNAWTPANRDSDIPALSTVNLNNETRTSNFMLETGSYLRLANLELGFSVPSSFRDRIGARDFRLFFNAQNIFTITGLTMGYPETPTIGEGDIPYIRPSIFTAGVDITF